MRDRNETILRIVCLVLAVLVAWQLGNAVFRACSLVRVNIPAAPGLATDEPAAGQAPNKPPMLAKGTNVAATELSTNSVTTNKTTVVARLATNRVVSSASPELGTNSLPPAATNGIAISKPPKPMGTNVSAGATNVPAVETKLAMVAATNNLVISTKTNSSPSATAAMRRPPGMPMPGGAMMMGMSGGSFPMHGRPTVSLPPEIQSRVDKIVDSEILGPVMRPMPMALMGIAGDVAFLRTATGQTGLVKEGDTLGDLKLLSIGINRVLVAVGGQTNELTIFNGYGSDSLLSEPKETSK